MKLGPTRMCLANVGCHGQWQRNRVPAAPWRATAPTSPTPGSPTSTRPGGARPEWAPQDPNARSAFDLPNLRPEHPAAPKRRKTDHDNSVATPSETRRRDNLAAIRGHDRADRGRIRGGATLPPLV